MPLQWYNIDMKNTITIYHGSKDIIEKPKSGIGNPRNDYGLGFYCTESVDLAKEWACTNLRGGYANEYKLDLNDLNILDLSDSKYSILNWLTILLQNRTFNINNEISKAGKEYLINNFNIDLTDYDIIKGYRADDSYFSFVQDFLNNTITVKKLAEAMKLGKLGEQIVLKSPKAFSHIKFVKYEEAQQNIYYPLRKSRDTLARNAYFNNRQSTITDDDLFLIDIIRKGIDNNDPRL